MAPSDRGGEGGGYLIKVCKTIKSIHQMSH